MDHRPFEDWLLDDQPLTNDQERQLNTHLRTCSSCTTLAEVDLALKSVAMVEPAAGFTGRFQVQLAERKKALRRRNFWGFGLLTVSVLVILLLASWPVLNELVQSPVNTLVTRLSWLVSIWASLEAIFRAGEVLFRVVPGFIPLYIWMVVLFAAGGWGLVWAFSLMKLSKYRQGV
jgi:hypothetical protein